MGIAAFRSLAGLQLQVCAFIQSAVEALPWGATTAALPSSYSDLADWPALR